MFECRRPGQKPIDSFVQRVPGGAVLDQHVSDSAAVLRFSWGDVETNQNARVRGAIDGSRHAPHSVACGVDSLWCRLLPQRAGTAGHSFSVEGGSAVAAQGLLDGLGLSLCLPAPRRPARFTATSAGFVESGTYPLHPRGAARTTRPAERGPQVSRGSSRCAGAKTRMVFS